MISAIISLGQIVGAELWLVGWGVCVVIYFAILLPNKHNRGYGKNVLFWFLIAEVLTDLCWALVYYKNSVYFNYGIGAVYGLVLWPVALVIAGIIATMQNKKEHQEKVCVDAGL